MMRIADNLYRWWSRMPWPRRIICGLCLVVVMLLLTPTEPAAACGLADGSCMMDQGIYNAMLITAKGLWLVNRLILVVAYLLDIIRFTIVDTLFLGAYTQLTNLVSEAVVPVAMLALTIAFLAILAAPLVGTGSPFNIRQIFVIVMFAPVVLLGLGTWLGDIEKLRVDIGQVLYSAGAGGGDGGINTIAPTTGDMMAGAPNDPNDPRFLYPSSCPAGPNGGRGALLPRRTGGLEAERQLRPDEMAAAFLYASAADIHCPYNSGAEIEGLPAAWAGDPPQYIHGGDIGDQGEATRIEWKDQLTQGLMRLFLGLFVSILALVYYATHLVFTLALVAVWVGIPVGLLFGMFRRDFGWAGEYIKSAADILRNSWVTSFIIGLLMAALIAASNSGNATVFAGIAVGQLVFLVFTFFNSLKVLQSALSALASVAASIVGGAANGGAMLSGAAGMVGRGAMMAMTGGAGMAVGAAQGVGAAGVELGRMASVGRAAARESGSATYGLAAALGRNSALMKAGEVARSMGLIGGERGPLAGAAGQAVLEGMRAGAVSNKGFREFNQRLASHASRGGQVIRAYQEQQRTQAAARAEQKQEQRQVAALGRLREGNIAQRGVLAAQATPEAVAQGTRAAVNAVRNIDPRAVVEGAVTAGRAALQAAETGAYTALGAGMNATAGAVVGGADAARRALDPNARFESAWRYDEHGRRVRVDGAEAEVPEHAKRGHFSNEELHREMLRGATVRFHDDDTASVWSPATEQAHAAEVAAAEEAHQAREARQEAAQAERAAAIKAREEHAAAEAAFNDPANEVPVTVIPPPPPPEVEEIPVKVIGQGQGQGKSRGVSRSIADDTLEGMNARRPPRRERRQRARSQAQNEREPRIFPQPRFAPAAAAQVVPPPPVDSEAPRPLSQPRPTFVVNTEDFERPSAGPASGGNRKPRGKFDVNTEDFEK